MRYIPLVTSIFCLVSASAGAQMSTGRGVLGVMASDLPQNAAGLRGALVRQVAPGLAASSAGVRPNDVIVGIDGQSVVDASALTAYVAGHGAGDSITLQILRPTQSGADRVTLTAALGGGAPAVRPSRPTPAAAVENTGEVGWTRFADPHEAAFSMDVPAGWDAFGGLLRHTATDPSLFLRVLSPDRRTYLMIGHPDVTVFSTPIVTIFGQRQPERGAVLNYLPGAAFARAHLERTIPALCGDISIAGQRDRPDLANGPWASVNPQARHDGGEVTFTCTHGGARAKGIIAASTYILNLPGASGGTLWSVDFLAGVIAPPEEYDAAVAMLGHIVTSTRLNPEWARGQQALTRQAANFIDDRTRSLIAASEENMAAARTRQNQFDQQFEAFDRTITGRSPYADSAGNVYDMDNTRLYHWVGPNGRTTTTNGPAAPDRTGGNYAKCRRANFKRGTYWTESLLMPGSFVGWGAVSCTPPFRGIMVGCKKAHPTLRNEPRTRQNRRRALQGYLGHAAMTWKNVPLTVFLWLPAAPRSAPRPSRSATSGASAPGSVTVA